MSKKLQIFRTLLLIPIIIAISYMMLYSFNSGLVFTLISLCLFIAHELNYKE